MPFKKILAAVRTTGGPSAVFQRALEVAVKEGASLMLFHCAQPETLAELEERVGTMSYTELDASRSQRALDTRESGAIEHLQAWLEELCAEAKKQGVSAKCLVEEGKPGKRIVELAKHWEADLIIIGRTRRGSIADVLFGTVSDYVIHHARCSLLLVQ